MEAQVILNGELTGRLIRANGTEFDIGLLSATRFTRKVFVDAPKHYLRKMWQWMKSVGIFNGLVTFGAFIGMLCYGIGDGSMVAIVTTAGATYMATDFASAGVTPTISGFKFHDAGTGSTAAAVTDTALGTAWGGARITGTPTNPSAQVYRSVATIPFTGTFAITEWGLFSASSSGTLWDRRVFSAINVVNGDSIQFTYNLTVPNSGS